MSTDADSIRKPPKTAADIFAIAKDVLAYGKQLEGIALKMRSEKAVKTISADGTDKAELGVTAIKTWADRLTTDYATQFRLSKRAKRKPRFVVQALR